MKPLNLKVPWQEVKERLQEINIHLTDEDLAYDPGHENELLERLQYKIKGTTEDIRGLIESVSENEGKAG